MRRVGGTCEERGGGGTWEGHVRRVGHNVGCVYAPKKLYT